MNGLINHTAAKRTLHEFKSDIETAGFTEEQKAVLLNITKKMLSFMVYDEKTLLSVFPEEGSVIPSSGHDEVNTSTREQEGAGIRAPSTPIRGSSQVPPGGGTTAAMSSHKGFAGSNPASLISNEKEERI